MVTTEQNLPRWFKALRRTRGRAKEYCEWSVEPYGSSCEHGCKYCYAPKIAKKSRDGFAIPKPDFKILEKLRIDLDQYADAVRPEYVQLGFFCDPYQPIEQEHQISRQVIELLHSYGIRVQILTKSDLVVRDFDILRRDDKVGCTITFDNTEDSKRWEPNASTPNERLAVLKAARAMGFQVWASLEPVIYPDQAIHMIQRTKGIVDLYKIGHTNHTEDFEPELQEIVGRIDWQRDGKRMIQELQKTGAEFYVKKDLREALGNDLLIELSLQ